MTQIKKSAEREFVLEPLVIWFQKQKIWDIIPLADSPQKTGWDLQVRRPNLDLLIEAKYIQRSFISSFSTLVTSPLTKRSQYFMKTKAKSWCAYTCWAIGSSYGTRDIFQILFDYFCREPIFWEHYGEDLKMKYVYFVNKRGEVANIHYSKLIDTAKKYLRQSVNKTKNEQREIANKLMSNLKYS